MKRYVLSARGGAEATTESKMSAHRIHLPVCCGSHRAGRDGGLRERGGDLQNLLLGLVAAAEHLEQRKEVDQAWRSCCDLPHKRGWSPDLHTRALTYLELPAMGRFIPVTYSLRSSMF